MDVWCSSPPCPGAGSRMRLAACCCFSATRVFCVSLRGGGRNEMNLLRTALKHAQLPHPPPIHCPSTPPSISPVHHGTWPMALDPWPLTPRPIHHEATQPNQPSPHCCHLLLLRRMLPFAPHSAAVLLCPFYYDDSASCPWTPVPMSTSPPPPDCDDARTLSSSAPGLGMTLFSTCRGLDTKGGALLFRPLGLMR